VIDEITEIMIECKERKKKRSKPSTNDKLI